MFLRPDWFVRECHHPIESQLDSARLRNVASRLSESLETVDATHTTGDLSMTEIMMVVVIVMVMIVMILMIR